MQSLAAGVLVPERWARQRKWMRPNTLYSASSSNNGSELVAASIMTTHSGMKLAREIATVKYGSGSQGSSGLVGQSRPKQLALCLDFVIETYLDHAGEKGFLEYDANSLLYLSMVMDLFDVGKEHKIEIARLREQNERKISSRQSRTPRDQSCYVTLPQSPYSEHPPTTTSQLPSDPVESSSSSPLDDLIAGLGPLRSHRALVMDVASDTFVPAWQQREISETWRAAGNRSELMWNWGGELGEHTPLFEHDTFLLDLKHIGRNI